MELQARIYESSPQWMQTVLLNVHAARIQKHRYGRPFEKAVEWLIDSENWSSDQLRDHQDARIRKVVSAAYESSPYYRAVFDERGIRPADVTCADDLIRLPVVSKADIKANAAAFLAGRPERSWHCGHTSGTTGSPLSVWYDRKTCIMTNAVDRRHKMRAGMKRSDWIGLLLGRTIVPVDQEKGAFWRTNWMQREVWFSSFHMTPTNLDRYLQEIKRRGLRFLEGYPSTLYILAKHVLAEGTSLPMDAVISSSETLHPIQRSTIEAAFECRLFDFYAQAERVAYAGECVRHAGKHIAEEYGFLEVVDEEGRRLPDGDSGYLVGTSLWNTAMPLIRYRTGDVSAIIGEKCDCGRSHRRLKDIATKAEDMVVTPEGRIISPSVLTHPFKPFENIEKSQILQVARDQVVVRIVKGRGFTPESEDQLVNRLRDRLGPSMLVRVEVVADIPREPSGKFRWVISHVDTPYDLLWE